MATLGTFSNYAPLLSVVGLWSATSGAEGFGIGAPTGVTMAATVGMQLIMSRLLRRWGPRPLLAAGAVLLGVPTIGYLLSADLPWVLAVSAVRGIGFGMVTVAGSALVAELTSVHERGRAVGLYGAAAGLPQVVCLPLGVWFAEHVGFAPIFWVTGSLSTLTVLPVVLMSRPVVLTPRRPGPRAEPGRQDRPIGRIRRLAGPWTVMIVSACAFGATTAFLPVALPSPGVVALALFTLSVGIVVGRMGAGALGDRVELAGRVLVPATALCALGVGGLAATITVVPLAALVVASAAGYGLGFGAVQNDTLVVMFQRAGPGEHGGASAGWNMAYDSGTGVGALAVGALSPLLGVGGAIGLLAIAIALTLWWANRAQ